jgi:hypothetical protein
MKPERGAQFKRDRPLGIGDHESIAVAAQCDATYVQFSQ